MAQLIFSYFISQQGHSCQQVMLTYLLRNLIIFSQQQPSMASRDKKIQHITKKGSHISKEPHKSSKKQPQHRSPTTIYSQNRLFSSNRIVSNSKKQSRGREMEGVKNSHKVITTDESNNCFESKIHESIFYCENKQPNEQYFQSVSIKDKGQKKDSVSSSRRSSKLKDLSCKLKEMQKLVVEQDRELAAMKGTISEKELHRLIKMHSIERLKVVSTIKNRVPSKRKNKL